MPKCLPNFFQIVIVNHEGTCTYDAVDSDSWTHHFALVRTRNPPKMSLAPRIHSHIYMSNNMLLEFPQTTKKKNTHRSPPFFPLPSLKFRRSSPPAWTIDELSRALTTVHNVQALSHMTRCYRALCTQCINGCNSGVVAWEKTLKFIMNNFELSIT